jgi:iron complex transport system substrate-binding protein
VRIVSLVSSATEIACALGLETSLVGISHECDYPASILGLPRLTSARLDASAPSGEIDRQVRERAQSKLPLYEVDAARLRALEPDVILTQAQCDVCAVSLSDVERALESAPKLRAKVVPLGGADLAGVWADIRRVAKAVGIDPSGLLGKLDARLEALRSRAAGRPRPAVLCLEWLDPPMASGNWVPELVEAAGGASLFGEAGRHSPTLDWDAVRKADPEVIVALPCGFDVERTLKELPSLTRRPGFRELRAARDGRLFVADGNAYFNRPGPRLVDSAELLGVLLDGSAEFGPEVRDLGDVRVRLDRLSRVARVEQHRRR